MGILPLLTLDVAVAAPTTTNITFSSDSVYKQDKILTITVQENYDEENNLVSKDLLLTENYIFGYSIYDNKETPYLDGLKVDDQWVTDGIVKNFDDTIEHTIYVKTTYADDIAGTFAAAKDGDWSKLMQNPLVLLQIFYYVLAGISVILGGFGLLKSRKSKAKTASEISAQVNFAADRTSNMLTTQFMGIIDDVIKPTFNSLKNQNQDIIQALMLAQSGRTEDTLALIDLLRKTSLSDFTNQADMIKQAVLAAAERAANIKSNAAETINQIAQGTYETQERDDGTSI